jgi:hypothetical protein
MGSITEFARRALRHATVIATVAGLFSILTAAAPPAWAIDEQRAFDTAEAAAKAFVQMLGTGDRQALGPFFGTEHLDAVAGTEETATDTKRDMRIVHEAAKKTYTLRPDDDDTVTIVIGDRAWPMPIPIVRREGRWRFDTPAGIEEIINRRIGRNELTAIAMSRAYIDAQLEYSRVDHDGDRVLEYARRLASTGGERNGLYWPSSASNSESGDSLLGPLIAAAEDDFAANRSGDPFRGYYFRVIERQGSRAPGGRHDYVINGNMIAGFALIAVPAEYRNSGVMTFMVSHHGKVYQKDMGGDTEILAAAIRAFEPDDTWAVVEE